jgi:hypothetical protein
MGRIARLKSVARRISKSGEMAEWLKAHAWKACIGETLSWVRIPLSPPSPLISAGYEKNIKQTESFAKLFSGFSREASAERHVEDQYEGEPLAIDRGYGLFDSVADGVGRWSSSEIRGHAAALRLLLKRVLVRPPDSVNAQNRVRDPGNLGPPRDSNPSRLSVPHRRTAGGKKRV